MVGRHPLQLKYAINDALKSLSHIVEVDRAYILLYTEQRRHLICTNEWVRPNCPSIKKTFKFLPTRSLVGVEQVLHQHNNLIINSIDELDTGDQLKQLFQQHQVKSALLIPIIYRGQVWGGVGFSSLITAHEWKLDEIKDLQLAVDILANALEKRKIALEMAQALRNPL
nr:GAF domain-containing protein [Pleionea sp. CnH1-48]